MDKLSSFAIAAVLGLAAGACAQNQTTPGNDTGTQSSTSTRSGTDTSASSQTSGTQSSSGTDTASSQSSDMGATTSPDTSSSASTSSESGTASGSATAGTSSPVAVGVQVQSSTGSSLGTVVDVVSDNSGTPAYVVISAGGETAAVPYTAVSSMMHNGAIVMDQLRLQNAPKVQQSQLRDPSSTEWQSRANQYWGSMRSATPDSSAPTGAGTDQG